jgi:hypothetical protein
MREAILFIGEAMFFIRETVKETLATETMGREQVREQEGDEKGGKKQATKNRRNR